MTKKRLNKQKHVPVRTCIATGEKKPKKELIRLVRLSDGKIKVDTRSKLEGRGANLTMTMDAFDLAIKKKAIPRALKLERPLTQDEILALRNDFEEAIKERQFRPSDKPVKIRVSRDDLNAI